MVYIEINRDNKAKVDLRGNLWTIYSELALAVKLIADNKELEISIDEVFEMIKDSIADDVEVI